MAETKRTTTNPPSQQLTDAEARAERQRDALYRKNFNRLFDRVEKSGGLLMLAAYVAGNRVHALNSDGKLATFQGWEAATKGAQKHSREMAGAQ